MKLNCIKTEHRGQKVYVVINMEHPNGNNSIEGWVYNFALSSIQFYEFPYPPNSSEWNFSKPIIASSYYLDGVPMFELEDLEKKVYTEQDIMKVLLLIQQKGFEKNENWVLDYKYDIANIIKSISQPKVLESIEVETCTYKDENGKFIPYITEPTEQYPNGVLQVKKYNYVQY